MPELPDVELYLSALRPRIVGQTLQSVAFEVRGAGVRNPREAPR